MIHRMDPPADAAREPMPAHVKPMLARAGKLPADERGWVFEIKWDGVRALVYSSPGDLRVESRNLKDITPQYPELARLNRALSSHAAILDGEIVGFDGHGRPSFATLQRRMHVGSAAQVKRLAKETPVTYMIFDLLWLDGHSTMELAYEQRRELLDALALDGTSWQTPGPLTGKGKDVLAATAEQKLEGVLAKRLESTYEPGARSTAWVKIKNVGRQELVIGGWLPGEGRRSRRIGALLVGMYDADGSFRYAGRVGTGFSDAELDRLAKLLKALQRDGSPFQTGERPPRGSVFCEPELVAEIEFTAWTAAGSLRHPSYKGLRGDKQASEVVREDGAPVAPAKMASKAANGPGGRTPSAKLQIVRQGAAKATTTVEGRELKLSNLDKLLYPQERFAKRDVIDFYAAVADSILAHLRGRALTEHTEHPTALVFDLDPGEPATIVECCRVALTLKGMFENLGLQSLAKTSGKKGLQLYVPLNAPDVAFAQTKPFAKAVAELLEQSEPELVVSTQTKARRTGKVLIDWSQNDSRKTTVCVYSLRATPRPTVSTPVQWDEVRATLDSGDPDTLAFDAAQVLQRIKERGDLFAPVLSLVQQLPAL
jgi:bifunctional non-homologous end joining protein LigD